MRAQVVLEKQHLQRSYLVVENLPLATGPRDLTASRRERRARLGIDPEARVVMFQGNLFPKRGLEALVQVAAGAPFHVVIQGSGPLTAAVSRSALPNLHLLEACPNREVLDWLAVADLAFVYYGERNLNTDYACSGKFYNAASAGIPVLCNRSVAFERFQQDHGGVIFVDSLAPAELRGQMEALLGDTSRLHKLGRQMRAAAAELAKEPRAERLLAAFRPLFKERS
jgi:glycosyltransferase involved in cell wall biosynthesis